MSGLDEEILSPRAGLARRAEHATDQLAEGGVHPRALLLLADNLVPVALRLAAGEPLPYRAAQAPLWNGTTPAHVTLCAPGVGAPAAAMAVEKLVAAGARTLVAVGYAGGLGRHGRGARISVKATLRGEEGVSQHYGCYGENVRADGGLAKSLAARADALGLVVTTDAPYRETRRKVADWHAAGALAVDMETAGILAPAVFRGVRAGALLVVTDTLGDAWTPAPVGSVEAAAERAVGDALAVLGGTSG